MMRLDAKLDAVLRNSAAAIRQQRPKNAEGEGQSGDPLGAECRSGDGGEKEGSHARLVVPEAKWVQTHKAATQRLTVLEHPLR